MLGTRSVVSGLRLTLNIGAQSAATVRHDFVPHPYHGVGVRFLHVSPALCIESLSAANWSVRPPIEGKREETQHNNVEFIESKENFRDEVVKKSQPKRRDPRGSRNNEVLIPTAHDLKLLEEGRKKTRTQLVVAFDGTGYHGSQFNRPEFPSIDGALEDALFKAGCIRESNLGDLRKSGWSTSSRTDKGVHSLFSVVKANLLLAPRHLAAYALNVKYLDPACIRSVNSKGQEHMDLNIDTYQNTGVGSGRGVEAGVFDMYKLAAEINEHLPEQIRVLATMKGNKLRAAKFMCNERTYEYLLPVDLLSRCGYTVDELRELVSTYEGNHSFHNFTSDIASSYRGRFENMTMPMPAATPSSSCSEGVLKADLGAQEANFKPVPSNLRWMKMVTVTDPFVVDSPNPSPPFSDGSQLPPSPISFVAIRVRGQSFLLNQIRKMVGGVLGVMLGWWPREYLDIALRGPYSQKMPLAPAFPLYLRSSVFLLDRVTEVPAALSPLTAMAADKFRKGIIYRRISSLYQYPERKWSTDRFRAPEFMPPLPPRLGGGDGRNDGQQGGGGMFRSESYIDVFLYELSRGSMGSWARLVELEEKQLRLKAKQAELWEEEDTMLGLSGTGTTVPAGDEDNDGDATEGLGAAPKERQERVRVMTSVQEVIERYASWSATRSGILKERSRKNAAFQSFANSLHADGE